MKSGHGCLRPFPEGLIPYARIWGYVQVLDFEDFRFLVPHVRLVSVRPESPSCSLVQCFASDLLQVPPNGVLRAAMQCPLLGVLRTSTR
jgi:hypothetical protein